MRVTPNAEELPINVVGSSKFGIYPKISGEKTYNMFISDGWLINMPGWRQIQQIYPTGQGRGSFVSIRGGFVILVINATVLRWNSDFSVQVIGEMGTSEGEVFIDENLEAQICIVDGTKAYIYNWQLPPNLTVQTGGPIPTDLIPNYVTFQNGYLLIGNALQTGVSTQWYAYIYATATTISAVTPTSLTLQTKPDYPIAVVRIPGLGNNVLVMGNTVSEIWTAVATTEFFIRNQSTNIDYGCISVDTIAFSDKYVAWLGANQTNNPSIVVFSGQGFEPISTDGIDDQLSKIKFPAQSTAVMYKQSGHFFYQLTFYNPQDNLTLIYDFETKQFYHGSDQDLNYHPARNIFYFMGRTFFLSLNNATIYEMSQDFNTINEQTPSNVFPEDPRVNYEQQRLRICEPIRYPNSQPFICNEIILNIRQGNENILVNDCEVWMIHEDGRRIFSEDNRQVIPEWGKPDGCESVYFQGRVDLSLSKDGCEIFSNTVSRDMQPLAHRQNIMRWEVGGVSNDLVPKFRFWSLGSMVVNQAVAVVRL